MSHQASLSPACRIFPQLVRKAPNIMHRGIDGKSQRLGPKISRHNPSAQTACATEEDAAAATGWDKGWLVLPFVGVEGVPDSRGCAAVVAASAQPEPLLAPVDLRMASWLAIACRKSSSHGSRPFRPI
mmetsp:Transcript_49446/g.159643  ORF Transcript_49446/g.159643 Transcript_49446/m.159643 type:complete len:128 (-) Transcript_49446:45-428(-)